MSLRDRDHGFVFWASLALGLVLTLVALPEPYGAFRPFWLGLLVIYWALESPARMGLGLAFALGLAGDFLTGSLLGEHALRLVVLAFIVLRLRPRMRFFPMPQQALAVLALLINDRIVLLMMRAFSGEGLPGWLFWVGPVIGVLLWPWLFLLVDIARARARAREA
jgi:rod shape-determining protein MreD